jgi:alcohol dehydrogenase
MFESRARDQPRAVRSISLQPASARGALHLFLDELPERAARDDCASWTVTVDQMQAFVFSRYGGPEVMALRDLPVPAPGPGEVLIRVHAAGLNPIDYKLREGQMRAIYRYRFPVVAGNELSGVVADKGSEVTGFNQGDRVFARVDKAKLGAFAEYATLRAELIAKMPSNIDFAAAAGVPLAGLTALQTLRDELHVQAGDRIFISGGAGGVGSFAVQLAAVWRSRCHDRFSPKRREGASPRCGHRDRLHARTP